MKLLKKNRKGVTMLEYGAIAALISVVAISTLKLIGPKVEKAFKDVNAALP